MTEWTPQQRSGLTFWAMLDGDHGASVRPYGSFTTWSVWKSGDEGSRLLATGGGGPGDDEIERCKRLAANCLAFVVKEES